MAKKQQKTVAEPTPHTPVPNRDSLQRISFLYQASILLNNILPTPLDRAPRRSADSDTSHGAAQQSAAPLGEVKTGERDRREGTSSGSASVKRDGDSPERPKKRQRQRVKQDEALKPVARHLSKQMVEVAKKATVRMDPTVKRTKCKGCGAVLVPGVSSSVRVKRSSVHAHLLVHTCLSCKTQRRLPAPPLLSPPPPEPAPADPPRPLGTPDDAQQPKKKKRDRRARPLVFFEREGHVSIRGSEVVRQDEYGESLTRAA
ncbi:hypothetical protein JCM10207_001910 [Rhodosporidiobolus poonsookiae]